MTSSRAAQEVRARVAAASGGGAPPAAAFRPPQPLVNCHLALMSLERRDAASAQGLLDLSLWSDTSLARPAKPFFPGKLAAVSDSNILRSLLALDSRNRGNSRCGPGKGELTAG